MLHSQHFDRLKDHRFHEENKVPEPVEGPTKTLIHLQYEKATLYSTSASRHRLR